jgi:hypothetical protein
MEKDILIPNLLTELEGLEVRYPNTLTMKAMIEFWSKKQQGPWKKLYDTTVLQYDILRNYDITKEETVDGTGENHVTGRGTDTNETQKYSFDSTTPANAGKVLTTLGSGSDTNGISKTITSSREYGDASLRTTQQVLQEERNVALFNMYDVIISDFRQRFCLGIYC